MAPTVLQIRSAQCPAASSKKAAHDHCHGRRPPTILPPSAGTVLPASPDPAPRQATTADLIEGSVVVGPWRRRRDSREESGMNGWKLRRRSVLALAPVLACAVT